MTRWGLLPVAVPLVWLAALGVGLLLFPRPTGRAAGGERAHAAGASEPDGAVIERLLAGATVTLALIAVGIRLLGALGLLLTPVLFGLLVTGTAIPLWFIRKRGQSLKLPWREAFTLETLPLIAVVIATLGVVVAAGYLLPVWQWDALGYHLPYVDFALQRGTFADVPDDVPYISTYPHVVEFAFIAWRAMIPDDRLVELAHVPFGLLGAAAIAGIARRHGARPDHALAAGAAWITVPGVFLQLPSNYIDVASASLLLTSIYFVLGDLTDRRRLFIAAIAVGLFLGSKPNAPVGTVMLYAVLAVRAFRAESKLPTILLAGVVVLALGAESYVVNLVRHGNPIWPVRVNLGPLHLPGTLPMSDLLESGAAAPRTHGNVVVRILKSWPVIMPAVPVFDMRIGGLGIVFLAALPFALWRGIRSRSPALLVVTAAALASPDPAVARYILAFPGLVLALAVPFLDHPKVTPSLRQALLGLTAAGAALNVYVSHAGLAGEGPPVSAYLGMSEAERQRAVGADGVPTPFLDAIAQVGPGEITVFDLSADLPYLAWPFDLSRSAARIPDDVSPEGAARIALDPAVRMLIVGDDTVTGSVVRRYPDRFTPLFHCKSSTCTVFIRH